MRSISCSMAMEATHVRFARDVMQVAKVSDVLEYYTGAVYPDSRYYTGVGRDATHPRGVSFPEVFEGKTDFEKGWMTHAHYDDQTDKWFKEWFGYTSIPGMNDDWVNVTAVKLLEELVSVKELGEDLGLFSRMKTPTGIFAEDPQSLDAYYEVQRTFYLSPPRTIDDFASLFEAFVKEYWPAVRERASAFADDEEMMTRIGGLYKSILDSV